MSVWDNKCEYSNVNGQLVRNGDICLLVETSSEVNLHKTSPAVPLTGRKQCVLLDSDITITSR